VTVGAEWAALGAPSGAGAADDAVAGFAVAGATGDGPVGAAGLVGSVSALCPLEGLPDTVVAPNSLLGVSACPAVLPAYGGGVVIVTPDRPVRRRFGRWRQG
jgi:hypothetical protein